MTTRWKAWQYVSLVLVGAILTTLAVWQMGHHFPEALHRHSWQYRDHFHWVMLFYFGLAAIGGSVVHFLWSRP